MFFRTPLKGQSHAGILACCVLSDLDDDAMHDLLGGYVAVPTQPKPTYLELTDVEQAAGWLQQAEQQVVDLKRRNATIQQVSAAQAHVEGCRHRVHHAKAVEALGPLDGGRVLEIDPGNPDHYAIAGEASFQFNLPAGMSPANIRRIIDVYDDAFYAGLMQGRKEVRTPILSALGLLD